LNVRYFWYIQLVSASELSSQAAEGDKPVSAGGSTLQGIAPSTSLQAFCQKQAPCVSAAVARNQQKLSNGDIRDRRLLPICGAGLA